MIADYYYGYAIPVILLTFWGVLIDVDPVWLVGTLLVLMQTLSWELALRHYFGVWR